MRHTGTEQQKRTEIVQNLHSNMFVEAGAGAGKTTLIVARIANQLKSGMKPREIVAITFTNAATRSLRSKIIEKVRETVADGGMTPEETANMAEALDTIDQMQISTIHSFCSRMLKECCLEANLPMQLSLVDKARLPELIEESFILWAEGLTRADWQALLPGVKYRSQVLPTLRKFVNQFVGISSDKQICVVLPEVSEAVYNAQMPTYAAAIEAEFLRAASAYFKHPVANLEDIPDGAVAATGKKLRDALIEKDCKAMVDVISSEPSAKTTIVFKIPRSNQDFFDLLHIPLNDTNGRKNEKARILAEDNTLWTNLKAQESTLRLLQGGYENMRMRPYVELAKKATAYFYNTLAAGNLTNDLLIRMAKELVENSPAAREYLGEKFKCIYVDEFQDTDHVQDAMIRTLVSDPADVQKLRDGSLFVVGDPKQSIYRFRGAEPEVYFATKQIMENMNNALVLELQDNYRSNDRIIEWVNSVFAGRDITPGHPYVPMQFPSAKTPLTLPEETDVLAGVYKYISPVKARAKENLNDTQETADLILNLVNNPHYIPVYDKTGQMTTKRIEYRDILILCMKMPKMVSYAKVFKQMGIPFVMDAKEKLSDNAILNAFARMYAYLADPYDQAARVGALEVIKLQGIKDAEAENTLRHMSKTAENMSGPGKLQYLAENWKICVPKDIALSKQQLNNYLTRLTQMIENVLSAAAGNETAIAEEMQNYIAGELEHELVMQEDVNAVRFMNLHKAKGLEGNVVIWANRSEDMSFKYGSFTEGLKFYPSLSDALYRGWTGYNRDRATEDRAIAAEQAEQTRLEYVAVTRAQQVFIFMDNISFKGGLFKDEYPLEALPSIENIVKEKNNPAPAVNPVAEVMHIGKTDIGNAEAAKPLYVSQSPSMFEDEAAGKKDKGIGDVDELRPSGNIFGTVMHRALELLVERAGKQAGIPGMSDDALFAICARQAIGEEAVELDADARSIYMTALLKILNVFWKWFTDTFAKGTIKTIYTELPFSYFADYTDESGEVTDAWRHGSADLVLELFDGTFCIIDFKSDTDKSYATPKAVEERLIGKYGQQIAAYAEAVNRAFRVPMEKMQAMLISFPERHPVDDGKSPRITPVPIETAGTVWRFGE